MYNDRMATIAEEQQSWAREYMDMWQKHFKPYEIAQAQTNMELLPLETEVSQEPAFRRQGTNCLPGQTQAAKQFLDASTKGVDVNERMGLASADASNAWKDVGATMARESARMGVNPNSGRFARDTGGARHAEGRTDGRSADAVPASARNKRITSG